jgi:hypothetical protein
MSNSELARLILRMSSMGFVRSHVAHGWRKDSIYVFSAWIPGCVYVENHADHTDAPQYSVTCAEALEWLGKRFPHAREDDNNGIQKGS